MHNWNFTPEHPISLTLAADARLSQTTYTNDHIWEFTLGKSEPPVLAIETTFGLRARLCRIFPRFILNEKEVYDPDNFTHPIVIHHYFPNYLSLSFKPFSFINVHIEYWVPNSQLIAGRTRLVNTGHEKCCVNLEWAELLLPIPDGSIMIGNEIGMTNILAGKSSNLAPVLFLTGGAILGRSPYPSLSSALEILPLEEQETRWVHATLSDTTASFELAKKVINQNWEAELARIFRINIQQLDIHTGNKEWDTAFNLSQTIALQLLLQPTQWSKSTSFVTSRKSDQGFSSYDDGADYNYQWNGQSIFDTHYLCNFLLPTSPDVVKGLINNFLDAQDQNGEIDFKPGLGGQRSHILGTPLLAQITLKLFEYTGEVEYLQRVFPKLLAFFFSWFSELHDRDGDQIPEWDRTIQTGYDDLPLFSHQFAGSIGADISSLESPDLCAYLFGEGLALISIANQIKNREVPVRLNSITEKLKSMVESTWNDQLVSYQRRDCVSHHSPKAEFLGSLSGPGIIEINREFDLPIRPIIHITAKKEATHTTKIFIHGIGANGSHRIEHIQSNRIHWHPQTGYVTSEHTYVSLERIEVMGIELDDSVIAQSLDFSWMDLSMLIPLWSGIPTKERAKVIINLSIMNSKKYLSKYGLRPWIESGSENPYPEEYYGLHLPWIDLVLNGLIGYGERKKAADIFTRIMKAVTLSLKQDMTLRQSYHCETGKPLGTRNSLSALIPVGLFLKVLGINIITPTKVMIRGENPFPWPITIKYQGLTVIKQEKKSLVVFPDGRNITIENDDQRTFLCETIVMK